MLLVVVDDINCSRRIGTLNVTVLWCELSNDDVIVDFSEDVIVTGLRPLAGVVTGKESVVLLTVSVVHTMTTALWSTFMNVPEHSCVSASPPATEVAVFLVTGRPMLANDEGIAFSTILLEWSLVTSLAGPVSSEGSSDTEVGMVNLPCNNGGALSRFSTERYNVYHYNHRGLTAHQSPY